VSPTIEEELVTARFVCFKKSAVGIFFSLYFLFFSYYPDPCSSSSTSAQARLFQDSVDASLFVPISLQESNRRPICSHRE